jgi:phytoene dehydrogenase-like protein
VDRDIYSETLLPDGRKVFLYADPDKLEAHFNAISPTDRPLTRRLCHLVRLMRKARFRVDRATELLSFSERVRATLNVLPTLPLWRDGFAASIRAFAARFSSPELRAALTHAIPADLPLLYLIQILGDLANGAAGSPIGGSLQIGLSMARRCAELGVRVHTGVEIEQICVSGQAVRAVRTRAGQELATDIVVAAADLRHTLDHLLAGQFPSPEHEALFKRHCVPSVCLVSCGLRERLGTGVDAVIHRYVFDAPRVVAGHTIEALSWKSFLHDPSLAPAGKSIVTVTVESPWQRWSALAGLREDYDAARAALGQGVVALMDEVMPGFRAAVQTVDVATPVTVERYTGNHHGHYMTFMPSLGKPPGRVPRTLPGLRGLYLAGMWVEPPGGLPNALRSGRDVAQVICRDQGLPFRNASAVSD